MSDDVRQVLEEQREGRKRAREQEAEKKQAARAKKGKGKGKGKKGKGRGRGKKQQTPGAQEQEKEQVEAQEEEQVEAQEEEQVKAQEEEQVEAQEEEQVEAQEASKESKEKPPKPGKGKGAKKAPQKKRATEDVAAKKDTNTASNMCNYYSSLKNCCYHIFNTLVRSHLRRNRGARLPTRRSALRRRLFLAFHLDIDRCVCKETWTTHMNVSIIYSMDEI